MYINLEMFSKKKITTYYFNIFTAILINPSFALLLGKSTIAELAFSVNSCARA